MKNALLQPLNDIECLKVTIEHLESQMKKVSDYPARETNLDGQMPDSLVTTEIDKYSLTATQIRLERTEVEFAQHKVDI